MAKGEDTRTKILDAAQEGVVAKGFGATSIDELLAATGVSKSGFFYHFRDKTELAKALIERYIEEDERVYDSIFARARELVDDPLQVFLLGLRFLADAMADLPRGHPGCLVALSCYHERQFDGSVRELNREAALMWRRRFRAMFEDIGASYPRELRLTATTLPTWSRQCWKVPSSCRKLLRIPRFCHGRSFFCASS